MRYSRTSSAREERFAARSYNRPFDQVSVAILSQWEEQQVRACLSTLTELQRQSVLLTYYTGHTYRQTANLLGSPHATIKTRIRDWLIRLRDCLSTGQVLNVVCLTNEQTTKGGFFPRGVNGEITTSDNNA